MGEMLVVSSICFVMTLIGLALGFALIKVQGEE